MTPANAHRTKIVCTLGPATRTPDAMRALVDAGMDVARLNFSHGTHTEHAALYSLVRQAADEAGRAVAVLADLQAPKIRLGTFEGGAAVLEPGALFTLTTEAGQEMDQVDEVMLGLGRGHPGDRVVIVAGQPGRTGSTSTVRVHELASARHDARVA